jgi:hypothetical protein
MKESPRSEREVNYSAKSQTEDKVLTGMARKIIMWG